jgi:hypothetical protein
VHSILEILEFQRHGCAVAGRGCDPDTSAKGLHDAVAENHAEAANAGVRDNWVD